MSALYAWLSNEITWLFVFALCVGVYILNSNHKKDLANLHSAHKKDLANLQSVHEEQILELNIALDKLQLSHIQREKVIQDKFETIQERRNHYVASLMADYLTVCIYQKEKFLRQSSKYHERQRAAKVKEIRAEAAAIITELKEAQYQLDYLLQVFPELKDFTNYSPAEAPSYEDMLTRHEKYNGDPISGYITRAEWDKLSSTERNQLALNRYISRKKNSWEIGRDYELYVAYCYEKRGFRVDTFGSYMRLQDLGRDLIVKDGESTFIVQCKCWSAEKQVHENSISQLYGTAICYCIENNLSIEKVIPVFVTTTVLSPKAKQFASMLKIVIYENFHAKDFPRIKCNIGRGQDGETRIYHLPMDDQYDNVRICKPGECYCFSVKEAEDKGFRRAYHWHGNNNE